jgi:hypothetical protein
MRKRSICREVLGKLPEIRQREDGGPDHVALIAPAASGWQRDRKETTLRYLSSSLW